MNRLSKYVTLFFCVSLFFLAIHTVDDAFNLGEAEEWGVTYAEFFFYLATIYLIIPPLGLLLARRFHPIGYVTVGLYALQAMYGGGINHVRHMLGDFGGSRIMPTLLGYVGIHITDIRGYGFWSGVLEMLGLAKVEPHVHSLPSSLVAFANIGVNAVLVVLCLLALREWSQALTSRGRTAG